VRNCSINQPVVHGNHCIAGQKSRPAARLQTIVAEHVECFAKFVNFGTLSPKFLP
jgi:hypothetical protein